MWKAPSLAHPSTWFCLLGSALALSAFFLPYWNLPPRSSLSSISLWDALALLVFSQQFTGFEIVVILSVGTLLVLLLSIAALAFLALFLRSPHQKIIERYLFLICMTLLGYLFAAPLALIAARTEITLASLPTDNPDQETLHLISVGTWLIPVALTLALIGGILLIRKNRKQTAEV